MKTCYCCHQTKITSDFVTHRGKLTNLCIACNRARVKKWKLNNPERVKAKRKEDLASGRKARWRKKEYQKHRTRYIRKAGEWNVIHRAKHALHTARWQKTHPARTMFLARRHQGLMDGRGEFSELEWVALCNRYNNVCLGCHEPKPLTIDHVIPLSKGGMNTIDNIQPLCKGCNSRKHNQIIVYR